jgi:general secretion pathway protein J
MKKSGVNCGFTLVEVLVATALLSLVMLGLLTAMRSFAQTEERIDERVRSDDDLRVTERFLRQVMSVASPRTRQVPAGFQKQIDFAGGADEMRWIGVMPARHGAGGLYRFRLYVRPSTGDQPMALMLDFAPYVPGFDGPVDPAAVQSRALAIGFSGLQLRYQDNLNAGEQWMADWPHADRLPSRIGVTLVGAARPWPEILVGVIPAAGPSEPGGRSAGGTAIGPF